MESTVSQSEIQGADAPAVPWYLAVILFASTCVIVGIMWDISWHQTIGRDSFWTPAHMVVYLGGLASGVACGWLALKTTFAGTAAEHGRAVRFWGFRAPLGAWVAIWGSFAMLASGAFDDWWHNAYGLDVRVLSPPHVVLALGIIAIQVGALLLALSWQNRAPERHQRLLSIVFAVSAGLLLTTVAGVFTEYTLPNDMHGSMFYRISAGAFPVVLFAVGRAGRMKWPATMTALVYAGVTLLMMWILPLFPAEPLLGPIRRAVTSMVPPEFPVLLFAPALAIDLLLRRFGQPGELPTRKTFDWLAALVGSVLFVGVLLAVQWPFAEFMLSEGSRNYLFQGDTWGYMSTPGDWQYQFFYDDRAPGGEFSPSLFLTRLAWAVPIAFVSARVGLWWGNWMLRVRR